MIHNFIVVIFNAPLESGLDYALQTMTVLAKKNYVLGYSLGEPITWKDILKLILGTKKIVTRQNNYTVIRPFFLIPGRRFKIVHELNYIINGLIIVLYGWFKFYNIKKIVWFFEPFYITPLISIFYNFKTVYDCVDFYSAFSPYARDSELKIFHRIDHIFANSSVLKRFLSHFRDDVIAVPQGFSKEIFDNYLKNNFKKNKQAQNFTVGYVGGIDTRIDFSLLYNIATMLPDVNFLLVGPIEENVFNNSDKFNQYTLAFFDLPNVTLKDPIPKSEIPKIIDSFNVGIIPYNVKNLFNKKCFPMKLMEYFYLGCPVISTPIEELQQYSSLVSVITTPREAVSAITKLRSKSISKLKINRMKNIAANNDWDKKITKICNYV